MRGRRSEVLQGLLLAGLAVGLPGTSQAQEGSVPLQQFAPATGGPTGYVNVSGASTLGNMNPAAELYLNYAFKPLVLSLEGSEEQVDLVRHQLQADVLAALGIGERLQFGVAVPVMLFQKAGESSTNLETAEISARAMGDIRLVPKFNLLSSDSGLGVALLANLTVPSGNADQFSGNAGVTFEPRAVVEYKPEGDFRAALNLGYTVRPTEQSIYNITVGNELSYGVGLGYALSEDFQLLAEAYGRMSVDSGVDRSSVVAPFEFNVAARVKAADHHVMTFGVGPGLTNGYGSPRLRLYAGYAYAVTGPADADGDGILNKDDQCKLIPEDLDSFQDEDGCPDEDNDADGIVDTQDKCPSEPEDKDNFEDADGCPDPDNDRDGLVDAKDKCPVEPEDKDGFQDEDGCIDPDNDGDGNGDRTDKCINDPEDKDGWQDDDGCPDKDNDRDGFVDGKDKCPNEPEVVNGVDDTDGCPDKGKTLVNVTDTKIEILDKVYFDLAKSTIQKRSYPVLKQVATVLKTHPEITRVRIEGHTDQQGDDASNMKLSQARAEAVKAFLVKEGVDPNLLDAVGYGESRPIADPNTKAGQAENRRVEFNILEIDGKPVTSQVIESPAR